jgi:hypothetical protein
MYTYIFIYMNTYICETLLIYIYTYKLMCISKSTYLGETLLIDMTEAQIFTDKKDLSFADKQIAGSFIGEMFSLISSDAKYSKDLLVVAKDVIDIKMNEYPEFPSILKEMISTYVE